MSTVFPGGLDSFTNPSPGEEVESALIGNMADSIEAIETKIGINGSLVPASLDYRIAQLEAAGGSSYSEGHAPELNGFLWWNQDSDLAGAFAYTAAATTSGTLYLQRVWFPKAITVTNIHAYCTVAGTVTGAYAGLYTAAGALLSQSGNTAWGTGLRTFALGAAQAVTGSTAYYMAMFFVHSSAPTLWATSSGSAGTNLNMTAPNLRAARADTGLTTTMPSNFGAQTSETRVFWHAVS